VLRVDEFDFASPLLGFRKSAAGYSGWYSHLKEGTREIGIVMPLAEQQRARHTVVNGSSGSREGGGEMARIQGASRIGSPLKWEVRWASERDL
jgi:hypothetical protein